MTNKEVWIWLTRDRGCAVKVIEPINASYDNPKFEIRNPDTGMSVKIAFGLMRKRPIQ